MTEGAALNCDEVRELLSPYLDRELTAEEMTAIAGHLEVCRECMEKSTVFGQLSRVIKHWEGIQASEDAKRRLVERVRSASARREPRRTLPLALLALVAGALLVGGVAALIVYLAEVRPGPVEGRPAVAECVQTVGRAELVEGPAPVSLAPGRELCAGQEVRCSLGAAVQVDGRGPDEGRRWRAVLHGPGRLLVTEGLPELLAGRLVLHPAPAADAGAGAVKVGRWAVGLPAENRPGALLVELLADGGLRVAVLSGAAQIGVGGPLVQAGTEVTMDAGGTLSSPRPVADPKAFNLLVRPGGAR